MAEPSQEIRHDMNGHLRVIQVGDDDYYVESSKGKICYKVSFGPDGHYCTCGDFTMNIKKDPTYVCKHMNAVLEQDGTIPRIDFHQRIKPRLDERFLSTIKGKEFVLYAGLLDLAHQKGIRSIRVEALQFPTKENGNVAICKAEIHSPSGEIFSELGDANPTNVNKMIVSHILRMAATRAKARAMRDYTSIGITCLEELGEIDDVTPEPKKKSSGNVVPISDAQKQRNSKGNGKSQPDQDTPPVRSGETEKDQKRQPQRHRRESNESAGGPGPSAAQLKAMENLARRRGVSPEDMDDMAQQMFGTNFRNITSSEAASFIKTLQQSS